MLKDGLKKGVFPAVNGTPVAILPDLIFSTIVSWLARE
jgi:hypothetical protein